MQLYNYTVREIVCGLLIGALGFICMDHSNAAEGSRAGLHLQPVDNSFLLDERLFVDTEILLIGLLVIIGLVDPVPVARGVFSEPPLGDLTDQFDRVLAGLKRPRP